MDGSCRHASLSWRRRATSLQFTGNVPRLSRKMPHLQLESRAPGSPPYGWPAHLADRLLFRELNGRARRAVAELDSLVAPFSNSFPHFRPTRGSRMWGKGAQGTGAVRQRAGVRLVLARAGSHAVPWAGLGSRAFAELPSPRSTLTVQLPVSDSDAGGGFGRMSAHLLCRQQRC